MVFYMDGSKTAKYHKGALDLPNIFKFVRVAVLQADAFAQT